MARAVLFLVTTPDGKLLLETGAGSGVDNLKAIRDARLDLIKPKDVAIPRLPRSVSHRWQRASERQSNLSGTLHKL